jgi:hypothetical protein
MSILSSPEEKMRALRTVVALLVFGSAFCWADTIYTVNAWAIFTATQPCTSNCTDRIDLSFQYEYVGSVVSGSSQWGYILPQTFSLHSVGFFGDLTSPGQALSYWLPMLNAGGDEIDLNGHVAVYPLGPLFMTIYDCKSDACRANYGVPYFSGPEAFYIAPSSQGSTVLIPEPSSLALVLVPMLGYLSWRRRLRNL